MAWAAAVRPVGVQTTHIKQEEAVTTIPLGPVSIGRAYNRKGMKRVGRCSCPPQIPPLLKLPCVNSLLVLRYQGSAKSADLVLLFRDPWVHNHAMFGS